MSSRSYSASPLNLVKCIVSNQLLIKQLIKREVLGRYKGSILGIAWSFFTPLALLAVYTFVFSVVFKSRWSEQTTGSKTEFALTLFAGLMIFNLFSECMNRAPTLILSNVNYVKKVVFPLEILSIINLGTALSTWVINCLVWLVFYCIFFGLPHATIFLLPLMIIPIALFSLGLSWFLSSLGVFIRDIAHVIGICTTILMFMTPVFYPLSAIPEEYRQWILLNPLAGSIDSARGVMMEGSMPHVTHYILSLLGAGLFSWLGFAWFQKTRKGFADVI